MEDTFWPRDWDHGGPTRPPRWLYLPRRVGRHPPVQQQLGHGQAPVLGGHVQRGEAFLKREQQGRGLSP